jgi:hypothetical protein
MTLASYPRFLAACNVFADEQDWAPLDGTENFSISETLCAACEAYLADYPLEAACECILAAYENETFAGLDPHLGAVAAAIEFVLSEYPGRY